MSSGNRRPGGAPFADIGFGLRMTRFFVVTRSGAGPLHVVFVGFEARGIIRGSGRRNMVGDGRQFSATCVGGGRSDGISRRGNARESHESNEAEFFHGA